MWEMRDTGHPEQETFAVYSDHNNIALTVDLCFKLVIKYKNILSDRDAYK